jgi:hypothetical protein
MAFLEIAESASSASVRSALSISNRRWYCLTKAFLGSVRIFLRTDSSRSSSVATTGRRPTNSGISPHFSRPLSLWGFEVGAREDNDAGGWARSKPGGMGAKQSGREAGEWRSG